MSTKPTILFVCIHNAGHSQMATGYLTHLAGDTLNDLAASSTPASSISPRVSKAMREEGINLVKEIPKILTANAAQKSHLVTTMGCGDACLLFPVDDPAGQGLDAVRFVWDEIRRLVEGLIAEIGADR
ncbi:phosphotyrosine protein phosphatase I superfamily [Aspergillus pseudodeflectus]|uniref:Phosphotyrosine protein phosphatase I superfamily n=1 Tax=Aspergillus pseudodeflectus TaxID=176178 RepID=A0ABR4LEI7_9EURO